MREIVKHDKYLRGIKYVQKLNTKAVLVKLNSLINALAANSQLSPSTFDHSLSKISRAKLGMSGLRELHVTGEILLSYRKVNTKLELVDICKNHKDLMKKY